LIWLSVAKHGAADRAIHEHGSAGSFASEKFFNGPLALLLRSSGSFLGGNFVLAGALVSRIGWIAVGKVSGADPEAVFASQR